MLSKNKLAAAITMVLLKHMSQHDDCFKQLPVSRRNRYQDSDIVRIDIFAAKTNKFQMLVYI
jgi:hypothetical protein